MKRDTPNLLKFKRLQRRLGESKRGLVGLLELLWIETQRNCPEGDIGRFTNEEIAIMVDWDGDPDELVAALVETRWLDRSENHILIVHDWEDHCPNYIKGAFRRHKKEFASDKHATKQDAKQNAKEPSKQNTDADRQATAPIPSNSNQVIPPPPTPSCQQGWEAVEVELQSLGVSVVPRAIDAAKATKLTPPQVLEVAAEFRQHRRLFDSSGAIVYRIETGTWPVELPPPSTKRSIDPSREYDKKRWALLKQLRETEMSEDEIEAEIVRQIGNPPYEDSEQ